MRLDHHRDRHLHLRNSSRMHTFRFQGSAHTQTRDFKSNEFRGTIKNLIPGKTYIFRIQAETKVGFGQEAIWKQKMPILAPPKPLSQVVPTEVCKSSTTIQIRFRKNYFSEQNGAITSYTIIVAEDDTKNASGLEMPSWRDVQAYSIWPPYQVGKCVCVCVCVCVIWMMFGIVLRRCQW